MQETWVQFLGWEDALEKEMATDFSILAWEIPWIKDPGGLWRIGSQRVGHDWRDLAHTYVLFMTMVLLDNMSCQAYVYIDCRGPAWETMPMAKVMRKEAWHTQRRDQASGNPLFPSIYPKTRILYGELSPITISLREGVNLQLQVNKNSWAWQECFSLRTPLKVI